MLNFVSSSNIADYLPLLNGAIITDLIVLGCVVFRLLKSKTLISWYNLYGLSGVLADVLSIMIVIIIAAFVYAFIFKKYSFLYFIVVAVIVQVCHDLLFSMFFTLLNPKAIPLMRSFILLMNLLLLAQYYY